jgi:hypothetical protein
MRTANLATPSDSIFLMVLDIDSGVVRYWGFVDSEDAKDALCFYFSIDLLKNYPNTLILETSN